MKSGETVLSRKTQLGSLQKLLEPYTGKNTVTVILRIACGWVLSKNAWGPQSQGTPLHFFMSFTFRNPTRFSFWRCEKNPVSLAGEWERISNIYEILPEPLHDKCVHSRWEPYSSWGKRKDISITPSSIPVSPKGRRKRSTVHSIWDSMTLIENASSWERNRKRV